MIFCAVRKGVVWKERTNELRTVSDLHSSDTQSHSIFLICLENPLKKRPENHPLPP